MFFFNLFWIYFFLKIFHTFGSRGEGGQTQVWNFPHFFVVDGIPFSEYLSHCNNLSKLSPSIARCTEPCNTWECPRQIWRHNARGASFTSSLSTQTQPPPSCRVSLCCLLVATLKNNQRCMSVPFCRMMKMLSIKTPCLMLIPSLAQNKSETEWKIDWQVSWPRAMAQ